MYVQQQRSGGRTRIPRVAPCILIIPSSSFPEGSDSGNADSDFLPLFFCRPSSLSQILAIQTEEEEPHARYK